MKIIAQPLILLTPMLWFNPATATDLFDESSEMQIHLSAPWQTLTKNIRKDYLYPAQLTFSDSNGKAKILDVKVEPRGNSRRFITCDFPPIKVHFDTEQTKNTTFSGRQSLRLTTYCKTVKV